MHSAGPVRKEKTTEVIERAAIAHGGRTALSSVRDSVSEGKLNFVAGSGAKVTIDVAVTRKDDSRVQRILKDGGGELHQGTDGVSTWESFNGVIALAPGGLASSYIESETVRAVGNLFGKQATVRDAGTKSNAHVVEVQSESRSTQYFIDDATSRVTAIEFVTGGVKESYVFSDFRVVQGVTTPFRIERYIDGFKIEETQFTSVRYNVAVRDDFFKP